MRSDVRRLADVTTDLAATAAALPPDRRYISAAE